MEIGTKVKINPKSKIGDLIFSTDLKPELWKLQDNPLDLEGTIIKIGNERIPSLPIIVRWENGLTNSYDYCNLIEVL